MENLIIHSIGLLVKISIFGQIYLLWISWLQPAIQKHYYWAKRADTILNKIYNIGTREVKISNRPTIWKGVRLEWKIVNSVFGEDKSIGKEDYSKWKREHSN